MLNYELPKKRSINQITALLWNRRPQSWHDLSTSPAAPLKLRQRFLLTFVLFLDLLYSTVYFYFFPFTSLIVWG